MSGRLQPIDAPESTPLFRGVIYPSWGLAEELPAGTALVLPVKVVRRPNGVPYVMVELNRAESIQVELDAAAEQTLAERSDAGAVLAMGVAAHEPRGGDEPPAIRVVISELP